MDIIKEQFRSVIQWDDVGPTDLFRQFTEDGDEIKNASKLIIQPGQGCLFTYEGRPDEVFLEPGVYELETDNHPFITTLKKVMNAFESEHKTGIWFFRTGEMPNIRWGTRIPIKYNDPVYKFPVALRGFGNFSAVITEPGAFFTRILSGQSNYSTFDLQDLILSRISQQISDYLANAKFSYADIDSNLIAIADEAKTRTEEIFEDLGFTLTDFRIEGTSFDEETDKRISEIADVHAEAQAASLAGVDFAELQKLKAMRDAAKNEGQAGAAFGMLAGMNLGGQAMPTGAQQSAAPTEQSSEEDEIEARLAKLKRMREKDLISEEDYEAKKQVLIDLI